MARRPAPTRPARRARATTAAVAAVLARPWLWPTAMRQAARVARPRWWRRAPFLPLPDAEYVAFRLETQYGAATASAEPSDLVRYLEWCRAQERVIHHRPDRRRR